MGVDGSVNGGQSTGQKHGRRYSRVTGTGTGTGRGQLGGWEKCGGFCVGAVGWARGSRIDAQWMQIDRPALVMHK